MYFDDAATPRLDCMPEIDEMFFIRANDPSTVENAVVLTIATAGLTLIEPRTLDVAGRLAYRSAIGALAGWGAWTAVRTEHEYLMPPAAKAGVTVGAVGAALTLCELGESIDGKLVDALQRAGVRRPRIWLAAATAVLGLGTWWLGRRVDSALPSFDETEEEYEQEKVELPSEVRALASALLGCTESFGAPALRAQLELAQAEIYLGEKEDEFYPGIGILVPEGLPRAVPADAQFPVTGRYRPIEGRTFDVRITIANGYIANLDVTTGADWSEQERFEWDMNDRSVQEIPGWPSPNELEFLIETPNGLEPVNA